jgi:hypothetical protein
MPFNLSNFIIPPWAKYVAGAFLVAAVWGHGYVKGLDHNVANQVQAGQKLVFKQGKVTTKIITKYVKIQNDIKEKGDELKQEGQSYAIKFPNDKYVFNNEFVRLYDNSLGFVSPLSSGESSNPSGVEVPQLLSSSINNNTAGLLWEQRAKTCEAWAQEQEKANK